MKKTTKKSLTKEKIVSTAKQYESKSSLNGKMSFLKGNVSQIKNKQNGKK